MRNSQSDEPTGASVTDTRSASAHRVLPIIVLALTASDLIFLATTFLIHTDMQHRQPPPVPPSSSLLVVLCFLGVICLAGSVVWLRLKVSSVPNLPQSLFRQRIFVSIGLANANLYLGIIWVFLGGGFAASIPFFAGPALVLLLFVLPAVTRNR